MFARWLQEAGQSIVQILPINEMPPIETLAVLGDDGDGARSDLHHDGRACRLRRPRRRACARWRRAGRVETPARLAADRIRVDSPAEREVAAARLRSLSQARSRRAARRVRCDSTRSSTAQSWWLDEYALFRSLHAMHDELPWHQWPEPLARADAARIERRARLARSRDHLSLVPAVDRRRAVGRGEAPVVAGARVRRSAVHDFGGQPRRLGAAARVPLRRDHRRAARRVQRDRTGLGPAAVASRTSWRRTDSPGCARARAGMAISTTASASITSSACIACTSARSTRRKTAFFDPADEPAQIALGEMLVGILAGAEQRA